MPTSHRTLTLLTAVTGAANQLPANPALRFGFENATGRPNLNLERGYPTTNGISSLLPKRMQDVMAGLGPARSARLYDTGVIVGLKGMRITGFSPTGLTLGSLAVYRARQPLGLVTCHAGWSEAASEAQALDAVRAGHPVIEGSQAPPSTSPAEMIPCTWRWLRQTRLQVTLPARKSPTLVVFRDNFFPGWRVRLGDGALRPAHPADVAFLGAVVPPGTTRVWFEYRPGWLIPGGVLSLLGLLLLAVGWLSCGRREPRPFARAPVA